MSVLCDVGTLRIDKYIFMLNGNIGCVTLRITLIPHDGTKKIFFSKNLRNYIYRISNFVFVNMN